MALGYVRVARTDDACEIARIQLATWRVAYRRLIPRGVLDQLNVDWLSERWLDAVTSPPSPYHRVLVAVEQARRPYATEPAPEYLVGFAASGPADADALAPDEDHNAVCHHLVAITEFLVEPRWGRRGHGSRLMAACVEQWRTAMPEHDRYDEAVMWVFREDVATITFLTSAGWAPDGAMRSLDIDDLLVPQIRLRTTLTNAGDQPETVTRR